MTAERRPDLAALLSPLKGFQRRTVDYAFERMYRDEDPALRFLVADEVGLGKTLIARGIVARAVHHLWDQVDRIDVVYVCSSIAIAEQNLKKLAIGGAEHRAVTSRLTLLPRELKGLGERKVNLVAFTPSTSFDLKSRGGRMDERLVLHELLRRAIGYSSGLRNLLQGGVGVERWRGALQEGAGRDLDETLVAKFGAALRTPAQAELRARLDHGIALFHRSRDVWPAEHERLRKEIIGDLRLLLARTCVDALEPDLIILDEFQRFRDLLRGEDEMSELARAMWSYTTPQQQRARVLLLSATPYRMYSTDAEVGEDDHYPDFIETTRFLMDDDEPRVERFKSALGRYRGAIYSALHGDASGVTPARDAVQQELRAFMVRTERVSATEDRAAMMVDVPGTAEVGPSDLRQWLFVDRLARSVGARDAVSLWKSAPYLPHFMSTNYELGRRIRKNARAPEVVDAVKANRRSLLTKSLVEKYEAIDPANGRLRLLARELLDGGQHELLWVPPTLPYAPLRGAFADHGDFTKSLVFSAWHVVPTVVSAFLSYEAERRMLAGDDEVRYRTLHRQRGLLRFSRSDERLTGMMTLALQYPCLRLADEIHPLAFRARGEDVEAATRGRVQELLATLPEGRGARDERWYWAAPALLDAGRSQAFLGEWRLNAPTTKHASEWEAEDGEADDSRFDDHVRELRELLERPDALGARPSDLEEVVTELALGAPGILAARALRPTDAPDAVRQRGAALIAEGLRTLFNQPTAMAVVRRWHPEVPRYWQATLRYAIDGGLGAVLEEHFHQQWDQASLAGTSPADVCLDVAREMGFAATLKVSRVNAEELRVVDGGVDFTTLRLRASFALRYGHVVGDDNTTVAREGAVRAAFNSPYRPFVLASTSIGQEGLDFHPWCHSIVHWNLPGNPVDLEQREGRVHRYEGHAVRKNVAVKYAEAALRDEWTPGRDVWADLFAHAARERAPGASELVPWWLCEGPHRVRRTVAMLAYSQEVDRFRRLKRDLVAYRLAFGQPRQQELLDLVHDAEISADTIDAWTLDLAPPAIDVPMPKLEATEAPAALSIDEGYFEYRPAIEAEADNHEPPRRHPWTAELPHVESLDSVLQLVAARVSGRLHEVPHAYRLAHAAVMLGLLDREGRPTPTGELVAELAEPARRVRVAQAFAESRAGRRWTAWAGAASLDAVDPSSASRFVRELGDLPPGAVERLSSNLCAWWHALYGPTASPPRDVDVGAMEPTLPRVGAELFQALSCEVGDSDIERLRAGIQEHVDDYVRASERNALLPVRLARELGEKLDFLLQLYADLPTDDRVLVVGAARYFLSTEDAVPDLESALGLDDDLAIFNWVATAIGRPDVVVRPD